MSSSASQPSANTRAQSLLKRRGITGARHSPGKWLRMEGACRGLPKRWGLGAMRAPHEEVHQDRVTFFIVKNDYRLLSPTNVLAKCLFFYLRHTEPFVPTIEIPCPSGSHHDSQASSQESPRALREARPLHLKPRHPGRLMSHPVSQKP
jgi:hypothetical protein